MAGSVNIIVARHGCIAFIIICAKGFISDCTCFVQSLRGIIIDVLTVIQMVCVNLKTTWINNAPIKVTQDNENNTGQNTGDSNEYLDPEP